MTAVKRTGTTREFSRENVLRWMTLNAELADSATTLAEIAAIEFGQDALRGPLADETHWIWDVALTAFESVNGEIR